MLHIQKLLQFTKAIELMLSLMQLTPTLDLAMAEVPNPKVPDAARSRMPVRHGKNGINSISLVISLSVHHFKVILSHNEIGEI